MLIFDVCSVVGWDHITEGLVQLGFALMESYGPKACFGKVSTSSVGDKPRRLTPNQEACQLGVRILQDTFRVHESSRAAIVEQLLNLIVTRASTPVSHYIGMWAVEDLFLIVIRNELAAEYSKLE